LYNLSCLCIFYKYRLLGPTIQSFEEFQKLWPVIEKSKFLPLERENCKSALVKKLAAEAKEVYLRSLESRFLRDDYLELVELSLLVLGAHPDPANYMFKFPGANHRARWMARIIYVLKMFLFRKELGMSAETTGQYNTVIIFFGFFKPFYSAF
jgi:hypothetical protein